jgi:hypothetical protein
LAPLAPRRPHLAGWKGMGIVVADKYPNLVRLNTGETGGTPLRL